ncbi:MAG TPA: hypothetical protein ENN40_02320 [Candidatus Aminicenantes bacterium]|nr:hypothetical protein [Candidatus Aminicenantes bacterium]
MVLDYRNTRFSFNQVRKRRRQQRIRWLAALVLLTGLTLLIVRGVQYRRFHCVQEDLLAGKISTTTIMQENSRPLFTAAAMAELQALSHLLEGGLRKGEEDLRACTHSGIVASRRFLDRMVDLGRYASLGLYLDFLQKHRSPSPFHRMLYFTARYRPEDARRIAAGLAPQSRSEYAKALHILETIWKELDKGRIACIHDYSGKILGEFEPATATIHSRVPGLDLSSFSKELEKGLRFFTLTLDARLQLDIADLFADYHGSCIILNPKNNAILAAFSKPVEPSQKNCAWKEQYEPGSVIKVLTYLCYSQSPDPQLFPLECRGNINVEKRIFYDWTRHGTVDSAETALVVSCNVAYARMGLFVGAEDLTRTLKEFQFNSRPLKDRCLQFQLGVFKSPPLSLRRLADLSVGLEEIRITTLHCALLAATISQSGSMASPHLIATEKNILKLGIFHHTSKPLVQISGSRSFAQLKDTMVRVIREPRGTGHRAWLPDGPVTAAKTGTAGNPALGLDAVMMGFLPAGRPAFAFAFRLERGGKAEINGARVLKALISGPLSRAD